MEYRPQSHGFLEVITGPMYSEKTATLMARVKKQIIGGKRAIIFKPNIDEEYVTDNIFTYDGESMHANAIPCNSAKDVVRETPDSVDIVGIDEGQFFDDGLVDACEQLANQGKLVIVAGLDLDYRCQPFDPMPQLMAVAETVDKLTAVCFECGQPATKIQRFKDGRLSKWNESTVAVDNQDETEYTYEARCRGCYRPPLKPTQGGKL